MTNSLPRRASFLHAACLLILSALASLGQVDLAEQAVGARTWTLNDGSTLAGGIEAADSSMVTLRLATGKTIVVELGKLNAEDRSHVTRWIEHNAAPAGFGKPDQVVVITAMKGNLKYDQASFEVYPGKNVQLVLRNADDMHHNLVICKRGTRNKGMPVAEEAWKLGADGFARHWIPNHPNLLFAGKMAEPHSTASLYFTAPTRKGRYPFVCTLPGHAQIMNGTMIVTTEVNPLSELTFTLYKGSWNKLPDWDSLTPAATDHVASGRFDLACTKLNESFGIVFNGQIEAPADGEYSFTIGSDDGSRLLINGQVVIDHDGIHGMSSKTGKARLAKGKHAIEVQYFEKSGEEALYVGWKPPGAKQEQALSAGGRSRGGNAKTGQLLVAEEEARIYRNFIAGGGPRAVGVGYPEGIHLAYDANNMRIAMMWRGDFIDAARHWNGRGQGYQPPAGDALVNGTPGVPFGILATADQPWPTEFLRKDNERQPPADGGYVFKGYRLGGPARIPSFRYSFRGLFIEDTPAPGGSEDDANASLVRTLKLNGPPVPNLYFRAAVAPRIESGGPESFLIGDELLMHIDSDARPLIRDSNGQQELLVPVEFRGTEASLKQSITWQ